LPGGKKDYKKIKLDKKKLPAIFTAAPKKEENRGDLGKKFSKRY